MKLGSNNYYEENIRKDRRTKREEGCYFRLNNEAQLSKKRYLGRDLNGLRQ